jgi:predicted transcriptional regulator
MTRGTVADMTPEERDRDVRQAMAAFVGLARDELRSQGGSGSVYELARLLGVSQAAIADRLAGRRACTDEALGAWLEAWAERRPEGAAILRLVHDGRRRVERG